MQERVSWLHDGMLGGDDALLFLPGGLLFVVVCTCVVEEQEGGKPLRIQWLSTLQRSLPFQFLLEVHVQSFRGEVHGVEVEVKVLCGHHAEVEGVYRPLVARREEVLVDVEEVGHQILVCDQEILGVEVLAGRAVVVEEVGSHALLGHDGNLGVEGHRGVVEVGNHARLVRGGNLVEDLRDGEVDVYHPQIRGQGGEDGVGDRLQNHGEVYRDGQVHGVVVEDIYKLAVDGDVGVRDCGFLEVPMSRFCDVHVEEVLASDVSEVFCDHPRCGRTHHH